MQIVKFSNGKFGIRKGFIWHQYLDNSEDYWWYDYNNPGQWCSFKTYDEALQYMNSYKSKQIKTKPVVVKHRDTYGNSVDMQFTPKTESIWYRLFKK